MNHTIVDSPVGPLTLIATDGVLSALYMDRHRHAPDPSTFGERVDPSDAPFADVHAQLLAYFAGELTRFDLPLSLRGTPFQRQVWSALTEIPHGSVTTYGQLADQLGKPAASRAVGLANGKNPISIIVPCHRVIGSSGSLTGYGGGLDRKRYLIDFEQGVRQLPV